MSGWSPSCNFLQENYFLHLLSTNEEEQERSAFAQPRFGVLQLTATFQNVPECLCCDKNQTDDDAIILRFMITRGKTFTINIIMLSRLAGRAVCRQG